MYIYIFMKLTYDKLSATLSFVYIYFRCMTFCHEFFTFLSIHFIDKSIEVYIYSKSNDSFVDIWGIRYWYWPTSPRYPIIFIKILE